MTEDREMIEQAKMGLARGQIQAFLESMSRLGYEKKDILELLQKEGELTCRS